MSLVRVTNVTSRRVLADRAELAQGMLKRLAGLLTRASLQEGEALVLPRCSAIHTCGMRFPIDVLFLKQGVAIKAIRHLNPFRLAWAKGADTVVELPAGTISRAAIQVGTSLAITQQAAGPFRPTAIAPQPPPPGGFLRRLPSLPLFYLLVLGGMGFCSLIRWPITAGDTDLWYHLTGGRYLFTHHAIPTQSFFSFISPPRTWVDYYWLFQAVVSLVHSWLGYGGLVIFRTLCYVATLAVIFRYLVGHQTRQPLMAWWAFILIACGAVLLPRYLLVRPHMVTLFFIISFLYILEFKPRRAIILPGLAVLWCNLHGIAYPVLLLITGAYLLEAFLTRVNGGSSARAGPSFLVPVAVSMLAVFLTPHGGRLLSRPWISTASASAYIQELAPLNPQDLLSANLSMMTPSLHTLFNLFLLITGLSGLASLSHRSFRISHWILCLAGIGLLAKGLRFMNECLLLSLPLLKANPPFPAGLLAGKIARPVYLASLFLTLFIPTMLVVGVFSNRPRYPFSHRDLPQGVVTFLHSLNVGGTVLNHPNNGGYLQWMLYPTYRIFMDMEVPFLFTDEDAYLAQQMFADETVLRKVLSRYSPSFIVVPNTSREFPKLIKSFPQYVLVFFDDVEVLYLNDDHHPALARRYELKALDPFALFEQPLDAILENEEDRVPRMGEARRLLELYPDARSLNHFVGLVLKQDRAYDRILPHAQAILRQFPESPVGYRLQGDAFMGLKRFDRAIAAYLAAIERAGPPEQARLSRDLGRAYFEQRQYERAYKALHRSINVFSAKTTVEDLYYLGSSALMTGRTNTAKQALTYLRDYKLSADEIEWTAKVNAQLTRLGDSHSGGSPASRETDVEPPHASP